MTDVAKARTRIVAPFTGVLRPLDMVPDPAFAQGLVGEGIAIDPLDDHIRAPSDGQVISVAPTRHSVTLRTPDGVELLIHVGIDTVRLKGAGFETLVAEGQTVRQGDVLIRMDADVVAAGARSLMTPILVVGGASLRELLRTSGTIQAGEPLMEVEAIAAHQQADSSQATAHLCVALELPHGLHARPSARIAELARSFAERVTLSSNGRSADATSTTALMALNAGPGDEIEIRAIGLRAREAAVAIADLLAELSTHEGQAAAAEAGRMKVQRSPHRAAPAAEGRIVGVMASPGLAAGPIHQLRGRDLEVAETAEDAADEQAALEHALAELNAQLRDEAADTGTPGQIAHAHLAILADPSLVDAARQAIASGASAGAAWRHVSRNQEAVMRDAGSARMRERAIDLRDLERRLLGLITGAYTEVSSLPPQGAIVVCGELEPSFLLHLPAGHVAGICTAQGGSTSHAAILAAAAGIPMLVAAGEGVLALSDAASVILDADAGWIDPAPDEATTDWYRVETEERRSEREVAFADAATLCRLADGTRVEVFANLASATDAKLAVESGAEGCGLLRTEFIFAEASEAPDEESQRETYAAIAEALYGRPLIVRTIDIGGDKPVDYLPFPHEANPALGLRGIRFALQSPEILRTQLRAILRGVPREQLRIMLPMVVDVAEIQAVRAMLDVECASLGIEPGVELGIMVETPAAALIADQLAIHADFLSIGSNDLAQYVLAMDRGNAALVSRIDAYHPAVLQAVAMSARAAARHGRWLGLCGGLASDPKAAPLLVGLGCNELSAVPRAIPEIKRLLGRWTLDQCTRLAERSLTLESADAVRTLLAEEAR